MRVVLEDGVADLDEGVVRRDAGEETLTEMERSLLRYLADHPNQVVERSDLLRKVWGYAGNARTRTVDVTMRRLRSKVERDPSAPERIVTVVGRGYRFVPYAHGPELLGRTALLQQLETLRQAGVRRLLLTGPGGAGKTTTARAFVAHRSGELEVELLGCVQRDTVLDALADALGLGGESLSIERLRAALGAGHGPVLLDNIDDVDDDGLLALEELFGGLQRPIVATSRRAPRLRDERVVAVDPLSLPDMVELLTGLLGEQNVSAEADAIHALAARLDGLPLAAELAASRARVLGVAELARSLPDPQLLADAQQPVHHRSLAVLVDASVDQLTPPLRRALVRLSSVHGTFGTDRARVVLGDNALGMVVDLHERSLLQRDNQPGPLRFRLLDTVQAHVQRLATADDEQAVWRAWSDESERRVEALRSEEPSFIALLHEARDDLLAAWAAAKGHDRGPLAALLFGALYFRERLRTLRDVLDATLAEAETSRRGELLLYRAWCRRRLGDVPAVAEDIALARSLPGNPPWLGPELSLLEGQSVAYAEPERAIALLEVLCSDAGLPDTLRGMACVGSGHAFRRIGQSQRAEVAFRRATVLLAESPARLLCAPLVGLGSLALADGRLAAAREAYERALEVARRAGDEHALAVLRSNLGVVQLSEHRWEDATRSLADAARRHRFLGRTRSQLMALFALGRARLMHGELGPARAALDEALSLAQGEGLADEAAWVGLTLALVWAREGQAAEARALVATYRERHEPLAQMAVAHLALNEGDPQPARAWLGAGHLDAERELEPEAWMLQQRLEMTGCRRP